MKLTPEEHWAINRENREAPERAGRERTEELLDRITDLESRLYFRGVLLESALELLNRRAVEMASLRSLIRMDVAMKAMNREIDELTATPPVEFAA